MHARACQMGIQVPALADRATIPWRDTFLPEQLWSRKGGRGGQAGLEAASALGWSVDGPSRMQLKQLAQGTVTKWDVSLGTRVSGTAPGLRATSRVLQWTQPQEQGPSLRSHMTPLPALSAPAMSGAVPQGRASVPTACLCWVQV